MSPPRSSASDPGARPGARIAAVLLVVAAIASFNLFYRLAEPAGPIWDESYYLTATARYELRVGSFASHPPLGLMLIAAGDRLSGANAGVDWTRLAADKRVDARRMPAGFSYWGVRCASALFGVLAAVLMVLLAAELAGGLAAGLFAGLWFLFDTALLAQFRAAQLDSFQLCFAAAALLCLVRGDGRRGVRWTLAFGICCGLATMVRANAVLLLVGLTLPLVRAHAAAAPGRRRAMRACGHVGAASAGMAAAVAAVFLAHLAVADRAMPAEWAAARADAPYVAPDYAAFLRREAPLSLPAALHAADGYRRFMAADVAGVGLRDGNASPPWLWLLGRRPIVYRWDSDGRTTSYVALVPNLAAWAASLLGVVGGCAALLARRERPDDRPVIATLLALWAGFLLSDLALAQVRVMYLYHYFLPLMIGWLLAAKLLGRARAWPAPLAELPGVAAALTLGGFLLAAPLALHQPLTDRACRLRTALNGGGLCVHATGHAS